MARPGNRINGIMDEMMKKLFENFYNYITFIKPIKINCKFPPRICTSDEILRNECFVPPS